ncbi:MAG TPA: acyl-CoA dehydrogenase family protein, partial [Acidimicrobiales bacterium]|nr:acyl-CoA dehydrogenase family protein [Acidimicrobiales bacterium]
EELPTDYEGFAWDFDEDPDHWAFYRQFWKKLGAKRWLEPGWPRQYGGAEMSRRACRVVTEELDRRRAGGLAGIGASVGPAILRLGTEEQKAAFLPGMAAGEIMWAEGYTEPEAGSDLASLRTRAERDGDDWVISGLKTFCTSGHHCNWIIIAARTDPDETKRHRGISYFLSPMDAAGIELEPLYNIGGGRQNLVHLDAVRVPGNRLLGDLNQGWTQIWFGLGGNPIPEFPDDDPGPEIDYEPPRTGRGWVLDQLMAYCRSTERDGVPLSEDPVVRMQLTDLAIGVEIEAMLALEGACEYGSHLHQAITKEFQPRFAQVCMEVLGPVGQIQSGPWAPLAGEIDRTYRRSFGNHAGGTSQLKRMVVATRVLGLPR